jgi:alkylation response protein AidB-like acyl-CoA dehydrogenase
MEFSFGGALGESRDRGREIGRALVAPTVLDRDRRARWDPGLVGALAGAGLTGALVPTGYGGLGLSVLEVAALLEGFGEGGTDAGLAAAIGASGVLCGGTVTALGSASQRERYLGGIASGERLGGLALSEVDGWAGGSGAGVTATPGAGGWSLDGALQQVLNAPYADHFLITAATGPGERTAFLVDRDLPGLTVLADTGQVALRTAGFGELLLTGCRVGPDAVLGTPGAASRELVPALAALDRTCLLAPWLGIARAVAAHTVAVAAGRPLFGAPLARSQSVRMAVVDLHTRTELAAGLLYRAAWELGGPDRPTRLAAATAKLFLAEALRDAVRTAAGLGGISPDPLVERTGRDLYALAGDEVLRSVAAGALLELG